MSRSIATEDETADAPALVDLQRLAVLRQALPKPVAQFLREDPQAQLAVCLNGDFVMATGSRRWREAYVPPLDGHLLAIALEAACGRQSWLAAEGLRQRDMAAGEVLILPAGEPGYLRLSAPHRFIFLGLRPRLLYAHHGTPGAAPPLALRASSGLHDAVLHGIATTLRSVLRSADAAQGAVVDHLVAALAAQLIAHHAQQPWVAERGGLGRMRLERALAYLDAHLAEPANLSDAAHVADCSVHHLAHLFKALMGISPMRYLRKARMQHARELLETTQLDVRDVGARVGITDPARFSQAFRAYWKTSPSALRRPH